jgi:pimeloyl-ACP methyl ester carboxylesterase
MRFRASLLISTALLTSTLAPAAEPPKLPTPPGPYGIGRTVYDWTDTTRLDAQGPDPKRNRELMVYLWYPTERPSSEPHSEYLPGAKQIDADPELGHQMHEGYGDVWPQILSGAVYSHAVENAPATKSPKQFPVVIFSHGLGGSSFGYTALFEALVSHGYVIAAIQHPGTADAVVFPDGRIARQFRDTPQPGLTPDQMLHRMMDQVGKGIEIGAADERFVLDRLTQFNTGSHKQFALAGRLDLNRVALMGHSAGADFAARACELDARFRACIDLDGAMVPVSALPEFPDHAKIQQPLLFLENHFDEAHMYGTHAEHLAFFKKKEEQLSQCPKGSYDITLNPPGMMHGSFSDTFVLHAGNTPEQATQALHNSALIGSYVLAFLDKNLKNQPAPLLDDPNVPHPDATIQRLGT